MKKSNLQLAKESALGQTCTCQYESGHSRACPMFKEKSLEEALCDNPSPDPMYSKDEMKNLHFHCENCGVEVVEMVENFKHKWVHGRIKPSIELL